MKQKYDLSEMEDYFECWSSPEKTVAGIDAVIAVLATWFTEVDDPCNNAYYLKECLDFLNTLKIPIRETKLLE